jgi:hypothetical protein
MLSDRMDRWEQEWLQQGAAQERVTLLSMLLQKKWGVIPNAIQSKIEHASSEELKAWFIKALHEEELAELENPAYSTSP